MDFLVGAEDQLGPKRQAAALEALDGWLYVTVLSGQEPEFEEQVYLSTYIHIVQNLCSEKLAHDR